MNSKNFKNVICPPNIEEIVIRGYKCGSFLQLDLRNHSQLKKVISKKAVIQLPEKQLEVVKLKNSSIANIDNVSIDLLIFNNKYDEKETIMNWNKESEEQLKATTSINMIVSGEIDLSRFINAKKIELKHGGKITLPRHVEYLSLDQMHHNFSFANQAEVVIDELSVQLSWDGKIDLSPLHVTKKIHIKNANSDAEVKLPPVNKQVILDKYVTIVNEHEITIEELVKHQEDD